MKDASALHPDNPCARHAAKGYSRLGPALGGIPVLESALSRGAISAHTGNNSEESGIAELRNIASPKRGACERLFWRAAGQYFELA
jgi:hypothetical protein